VLKKTDRGKQIARKEKPNEILGVLLDVNYPDKHQIIYTTYQTDELKSQIIVLYEDSFVELSRLRLSETAKKAIKRGKNEEYACSKLTEGTRVGKSKMVRVGKEIVAIDLLSPPDILDPKKIAWECTNRPFPKNVVKKIDQSIRNAPAGFDPAVWWYDRESRATYIIMTKEVALRRLGYEGKALGKAKETGARKRVQGVQGQTHSSALEQKHGHRTMPKQKLSKRKQSNRGSRST
jgi:hypothetical protein